MSETSDKIAAACPACNKMYRVAASSVGKQAKCQCGQPFTVEPLPPDLPDVSDYTVAATAAPARTAAPACKNHPTVTATAACSRCRSFVCSTCDYPQDDGSHVCIDCARGPGAAPCVQNPYIASAAARATQLAGAACRNHPDSLATVRCQRCKTPVCETCDFVFPGDVHICPACATDTSVRLSDSRKQMLGWSLAMAGILSLLFTLLLTGLLAEFVMTPVGDIIVTKAMQITGFIGLGLAIGTLDSRAGNPALVWVTVVWNGLVFGAFLLLLVIGIMATMGGMA